MRLILLALIVALSVALAWFTFTPIEAVNVVRHGGYWVLLFTTALWAYQLARSLRSEGPWRGWPRRYWREAVIVLAGALLLHVHERHEFKVVADEVVQQLTAQRMHFDREAAATLRAYDISGDFTPLASYLDKRPLFFPFLVSTLHDVTGYRLANAFVVNAGLSVALLALLWLLGRRLAGTGGALTAVLLCLGAPLVAQNACSAGFELLNLVMILLALWLGMRAVEAPQDTDRLSAFVLTGVLLAQVRYESALFVLPVAATVLYLWWRARRAVLPAAVLAAPLLLVICPLHFRVFQVMETSWQLSGIEGADQPFALRYLYDNIGHALNFYLSFDGTQPNSWLLGVVGPLAVIFFLVLVWRRGRQAFAEHPAEAVLLLFLFGLLLHTGLMLCYFWGRWDDLLIHRLSLPSHLLLILAIVYVWPHLVPHRRNWQWAALVAGGYLVAFALPAMAMHRYSQKNFAARANAWIEEFARTLGERPTIAVDNTAGLAWFLANKSAINPIALAHRPEQFLQHYRMKSFADYFVVQKVVVDLDTGRRYLSFDDDVGPGIQLELMEERRYAPDLAIRLSRIVSIDAEKLLTWAAERRREPPGQPQPNKPKSQAEITRLLEWVQKLP